MISPWHGPWWKQWWWKWLWRERLTTDDWWLMTQSLIPNKNAVMARHDYHDTTTSELCARYPYYSPTALQSLPKIIWSKVTRNSVARIGLISFIHCHVFTPTILNSLLLGTGGRPFESHVCKHSGNLWGQTAFSWSCGWQSWGPWNTTLSACVRRRQRQFPCHSALGHWEIDKVHAACIMLIMLETPCRKSLTRCSRICFGHLSSG